MKYKGSCHCGQIAFEVDKPTAAVNARCPEGVDIASLAVTHFDGRSL